MLSRINGPQQVMEDKRKGKEGRERGESQQAPTSQDATQATSPESKSSQTVQYQELINFQKLSNRIGYRTRLPGFKSSFSISCVALDKLLYICRPPFPICTAKIISPIHRAVRIRQSIHQYRDTFKYSRCMQVFH